MQIQVRNPASESGVYTIDPDGQGSFDVFCDMTTAGGPWLVFQRRVDGSVDFFRSWNDYRAGFGSPNGNFWLGNDRIARLTPAPGIRLRVDLQRIGGQAGFGLYDNFRVGSAATQYLLTFGAFTDGGIGDGLYHHNNRTFSTYDQGAMPGCSNIYRGGWWYGNCVTANMNGTYYPGGHHPQSYATGINWVSFTGFYESAIYSEMKIRR